MQRPHFPSWRRQNGVNKLVCSYRLTTGRGCRRLPEEQRRAAAPCPTPTARRSSRSRPPTASSALGDRGMPPCRTVRADVAGLQGSRGVRRKRGKPRLHCLGAGDQGLCATERGLSAGMGSGWTVRGHARAVALVVAGRGAGGGGRGWSPLRGAAPARRYVSWCRSTPERGAAPTAQPAVSRYQEYQLLSASLLSVLRRSPLSTLPSLFSILSQSPRHFLHSSKNSSV